MSYVFILCVCVCVCCTMWGPLVGGRAHKLRHILFITHHPLPLHPIRHWALADASSRTRPREHAWSFTLVPARVGVVARWSGRRPTGGQLTLTRRGQGAASAHRAGCLHKLAANFGSLGLDLDRPLLCLVRELRRKHLALYCSACGRPAPRHSGSAPPVGALSKSWPWRWRHRRASESLSGKPISPVSGISASRRRQAAKHFADVFKQTLGKRCRCVPVGWRRHWLGRPAGTGALWLIKCNIARARTWKYPFVIAYQLAWRLRFA